MDNLKAKGLTVGNSYKTQEELAEGNDMLNLEIGAWGGDFTVELKKYESLIQNGDQMKNVKFYTFGTQAQAKGYAELYVSNRYPAMFSGWRTAAVQ